MVEMEGELDRKASVMDAQKPVPFEDSLIPDFFELVENEDDGLADTVAAVVVLMLKWSSSKNCVNSGARYDDRRLATGAAEFGGVEDETVRACEDPEGEWDLDERLEVLFPRRMGSSILVGESVDEGCWSAPSLKIQMIVEILKLPSDFFSEVCSNYLRFLFFIFRTIVGLETVIRISWFKELM